MISIKKFLKQNTLIYSIYILMDLSLRQTQTNTLGCEKKRRKNRDIACLLRLLYYFKKSIKKSYFMGKGESMHEFNRMQIRGV